MIFLYFAIAFSTTVLSQTTTIDPKINSTATTNSTINSTATKAYDFVGSGYCNNFFELGKKDSVDECWAAARNESHCIQRNLTISFGRNSRKNRCLCNCGGENCTVHDLNANMNSTGLVAENCSLVGLQLGENGYDSYRMRANAISTITTTQATQETTEIVNNVLCGEMMLIENGNQTKVPRIGASCAECLISCPEGFFCHGQMKASRFKDATPSERYQSSSWCGGDCKYNYKDNVCEPSPKVSTEGITICGKNGCRGYDSRECPSTDNDGPMCEKFNDLGCSTLENVPCANGERPFKTCCGFWIQNKCLSLCEESAANHVYTFAAAIILLLTMI